MSGIGSLFEFIGFLYVYDCYALYLEVGLKLVVMGSWLVKQHLDFEYLCEIRTMKNMLDPKNQDIGPLM